MPAAEGVSAPKPTTAREPSLHGAEERFLQPQSLHRENLVTDRRLPTVNSHPDGGANTPIR